MPTRTDVTVVNQAYDTSGNGGRKLVRLSNGWLVSAVRDTTNNQVKFYSSSDNGNTWSLLGYSSSANAGGSGGYAIASKGTIVYLLITDGTSGTVNNKFYLFDATQGNGGDITSLSSCKFYLVDSTQTAFNGVSLAINSAGTELHATWASKNSTYPNSFNIRYAKGTINTDGSVTWGAVQQVTTDNSSSINTQNPCIIIYNNNPIIFADYKDTGGSWVGIRCLKYNGTWDTTRYVYNTAGYSYTQSSPSACVAPNGRIWVAWSGTDSGGSTTYNLRVSYSDDGGQTWSAMQKLTNEPSGANVAPPSITVNRDNVVFILYQSIDSSISATYRNIKKVVYQNNTWSSPITITNKTTQEAIYPSALYDITLNFSDPLFIYTFNQNKVGFYGTWTVTTISVTPGYIGQKTSSDKSNILSYSITTDGTMSTITEKINGTTIATRTNPTSGQQFTVSLSQAQWDAIKYGNAHTLTITMGSDTWTYTFDKRLNANDDILSAVKGVQDLQTHLNGIKAQLGAAIRAKGGTVNDTDAWSAFVSAVNNMTNKRWATGSISLSSNSTATISGLGFNPTYILLTNMTSSSTSGNIIEIRAEFNAVIYAYVTSSYSSQATQIDKSANLSISNGTVTWSQKNFSGTYSWIAFE